MAHTEALGGTNGPHILDFEKEVKRRLSPEDYLLGVGAIVFWRKCDLYGRRRTRYNKERIRCAGRIEQLISRARLGLADGVFSLTQDNKDVLNRALKGLGFKDEKISVFAIRSAAKEELTGYVPPWAIAKTEQRVARDEKYAQQVNFSTKELVSQGVGVSENEAWDRVIQEEARGLVYAAFEIDTSQSEDFPTEPINNAAFRPEMMGVAVSLERLSSRKKERVSFA